MHLAQRLELFVEWENFHIQLLVRVKTYLWSLLHHQQVRFYLYFYYNQFNLKLLNNYKLFLFSR